MGNLQHYIIRGGIEGRERLKIVSRILRASTARLFDRVRIAERMCCLDIGCGSGDVTFELARRVGPSGKVLGADLDQAKVELAAEEARRLGIDNVEFRVLDIRERAPELKFDAVYARFLLTHLREPAGIVEALYQCLRPGGLLIIEDVDFSGHFAFPESRAFDRYLELYCAVSRKRGGDPNIGRRLPLLLKEQRLLDLEMEVVQPIAMEGDVKLILPVTMENIAEAVVEEGLATPEELAGLVQELYDFAGDPRTLSSVPRIVQAWGRRPEG
ncbi:MAG TPA: methyltransferase domain-containing protein [Blastocatellia bacterium]|nr:methyltransferase domain-containing protein [Blastocatellia bacterium]